MNLFLLCLSAARAQDAEGGFDAHGFQLAAHDGDLRDPLTVQRPGAMTQGDFFVAGLAEYAKAPLVFAEQDVVTEEVTETAVVDNLMALNLSMGVSAHERVRFDLFAPMFLFNTTTGGENGPPAFGDLRLSAMVLGASPGLEGGFGFGLVGWVDAPTGASARFLGSRSVGGGGKIAATLEAGPATVTADLGMQANPSLDLGNLSGSDSLLAGLAVGVLASENVGITGELDMAPPLQTIQDPTLKGTSFPMEGILSMRYRDVSGSFFTAGVASGFTRGAGVAQWRAFIGGGFGRIQDRTPPVVEVPRCPDGSEAVAELGVPAGCRAPFEVVATWQGRPYPAEFNLFGPPGPVVQNTGPEGLRLQSLPGDKWTVAAKSGRCLAGAVEAVAQTGGTRVEVPLQAVHEATIAVRVIDNKGAPVSGATARWGNPQPECTPAPANTSPEGTLENQVAAGAYALVVIAPGYAPFESEVTVAAGERKEITIVLAPTKVEVTKEKIVILEKVYFETGKAIIRSVSFELLDQVATTIRTNAEIGRVEVAGHTDSVGSDSSNLDLSQRRAQAVVDYLVNKGVDPARLLAKGYGETTPIETNQTADGREKNRRVEFNLIDRTSTGGAE